MGKRPLSAALIGTWELISREDHTASGERRIDPSLGADPIALLIYDRAGHFAAQFMKRDRGGAGGAGASSAGELAPGQVDRSRASTPNNTSARDGYDAYFGEYQVDDAKGTVTQRLIGALTPENVGMTLTRGMTVVDDELTIQVETTTPTGEPIIRTLRWRRVG